MIFLEEQLSFLQLLQTWRGPYIDLFFRFLNLFDTAYFVCLLVPFVWIGCSWRWGVRLSYLFILEDFMLYFLKNFFHIPRPCTLDPTLAMVPVTSFSFPSGGASSSFLFGMLLLYFWQSQWSWPLGLSYILLVSFSRLFLGVHYPLDIVGGWLLGLLLFIAFIYLAPLIEKAAAKWPLHVFITTLVCSFLFLYGHFLRTFFLLFGLTVGLYASSRRNV